MLERLVDQSARAMRTIVVVPRHATWLIRVVNLIAEDMEQT